MAIKAHSVVAIEWANQIATAEKLDEQWSSIKKVLDCGKVIAKFTLEDRLVLFKNRAYIPDSDELKLPVSRQAHDAKVGGHFGRDKTMELLQ